MLTNWTLKYDIWGKHIYEWLSDKCNWMGECLGMIIRPESVPLGMLEV